MQRRPSVGQSILQILIVALALGVYMVLRVVVEGDVETAEANARLVLDVEEALSLDWERGVQDVVLDHSSWVTFWNAVYKWLYWPAVASALILLFCMDRRGYVHLRNALIVAAAIGIMIFWVFPVSPPRFLDGYTDTLSIRGQRAFEGDSRWTNAYAAVPSFHVGWTALAGYLVARHTRTRWVAVLALVPAALIAVAVVVTGNHFVIDGVLGVAVVAIAHELTRPPRSPRDEPDVDVPTEVVEPVPSR